MRKYFILFIAFALLIACTSDSKESYDKEEETEGGTVDIDTNSIKDKEVPLISEPAEATDFSSSGFTDKVYYELLIETRICNPSFDASKNDGTTPCSAKLFQFFPYNHKRKIEDAFLLQVKAGVNNYPYRRLLIFVREKGQLVMMNGVTGYLVKRIPQDNDIDDLVVAIIDDLGNDMFDRYDVLLKYKEGKYHFIEAIGDLQGNFDNPDLKERATKEIGKRIIEKELIF